MKKIFASFLISLCCVCGQEVSPPYLGYVGPCIYKGTNYTLTFSDYTIVVTNDNLTFTLPNPAGIIGREYQFKLFTPAVSCTITSTAGILFDGFPNYTLSGSNSITKFMSDGDDWHRTGPQFVGDTYLRTDYPVGTTTFSNAPALSVYVGAGRHYRISAYLHSTPSNLGGIKYCVNGTATATYIIYDGYTVDNSAQAIYYYTTQTALGGSMTKKTGTSYLTTIHGEIAVNSAGTLTLQVAQDTANGTSTLLRGSVFSVTPVY